MQSDEYRKLAEVEDTMWYFGALAAHCRDGLGGRVPAGGAVLDAGCGTGGLIRRLAPDHPGWRWSGIDFSPLAVELARGRVPPGVDLREASILALPHEPGSFDAVVSADVICQVEDPSAAVAEFARVLRPGGTLLINVPAHKWMWSYHDEACQTKHRFQRRELAAYLRDAGFAIQRLTHWNLLALPPIFLRRKCLPPGPAGDVRLYPRPVDASFAALAAIERGWIRRVGPLAAGTSILAVATKPR